VLQLEQLLTTGGGWQDQVGGVVGGAKLIATAAGLTPDPRIEFLPDTLLATPERAGSMLLYYTGITRVAKNLLRRVVARYLDREHTAIEALGQLRQLAPKAADALKRDDRPAFGRYVDAAWRLNKRLDPGCSTPEIEQVLKRAAPWIDGGKLLGAGGGGFLLLVGKSPEAAHELRRHLESDPPNDRARVFDFSVNRDGLRVTTC